VTVTDDLKKGLRDCEVVYTDVWVSMGEEAKLAERMALLKPYKVTADVMRMTGRADSVRSGLRLPEMPEAQAKATARGARTAHGVSPAAHA
jgi:hypothetical protein